MKSSGFANYRKEILKALKQKDTIRFLNTLIELKTALREKRKQISENIFDHLKNHEFDLIEFLESGMDDFSKFSFYLLMAYFSYEHFNDKFSASYFLKKLKELPVEFRHIKREDEYILIVFLRIFENDPSLWETFKKALNVDEEIAEKIADCFVKTDAIGNERVLKKEFYTAYKFIMSILTAHKGKENSVVIRIGEEGLNDIDIGKISHLVNSKNEKIARDSLKFIAENAFENIRSVFIRSGISDSEVYFIKTLFAIALAFEDTIKVKRRLLKIVDDLIDDFREKNAPVYKKLSAVLRRIGLMWRKSFKMFGDDEGKSFGLNSKVKKKAERFKCLLNELNYELDSLTEFQERIIKDAEKLIKSRLTKKSVFRKVESYLKELRSLENSQEKMAIIMIASIYLEFASLKREETFFYRELVVEALRLSNYYRKRAISFLTKSIMNIENRAVFKKIFSDLIRIVLKCRDRIERFSLLFEITISAFEHSNFKNKNISLKEVFKASERLALSERNMLFNTFFEYKNEYLLEALLNEEHFEYTLDEILDSLLEGVFWMKKPNELEKVLKELLDKIDKFENRAKKISLLKKMIAVLILFEKREFEKDVVSKLIEKFFPEEENLKKRFIPDLLYFYIKQTEEVEVLRGFLNESSVEKGMLIKKGAFAVSEVEVEPERKKRIYRMLLDEIDNLKDDKSKAIAINGIYDALFNEDNFSLHYSEIFVDVSKKFVFIDDEHENAVILSHLLKLLIKNKEYPAREGMFSLNILTLERYKDSVNQQFVVDEILDFITDDMCENDCYFVFRGLVDVSIRFSEVLRDITLAKIAIKLGEVKLKEKEALFEKIILLVKHSFDESFMEYLLKALLRGIASSREINDGSKLYSLIDDRIKKLKLKEKSLKKLNFLKEISILLGKRKYSEVLKVIRENAELLLSDDEALIIFLETIERRSEFAPILDEFVEIVENYLRDDYLKSKIFFEVSKVYIEMGFFEKPFMLLDRLGNSPYRAFLSLNLSKLFSEKMLGEYVEKIIELEPDFFEKQFRDHMRFHLLNVYVRMGKVKEAYSIYKMMKNCEIKLKSAKLIMDYMVDEGLLEKVKFNSFFSTVFNDILSVVINDKDSLDSFVFNVLEKFAVSTEFLKKELWERS